MCPWVGPSLGRLCNGDKFNASHECGIECLVLDGSRQSKNWCLGTCNTVYSFYSCLLSPQQVVTFLICLYLCSKMNKKAVIDCLSPMLRRYKRQLKPWHVETLWDVDSINVPIFWLNFEDESALISNAKPTCNSFDALTFDQLCIFKVCFVSGEDPGIERVYTKRKQSSNFQGKQASLCRWSTHLPQILISPCWLCILFSHSCCICLLRDMQCMGSEGKLFKGLPHATTSLEGCPC